MSQGDEPTVSRRQFFRGVTGDLLRVIGELSGLEKPVEAPEVVHWNEGEDIVPADRQSAALSDIFGFLEQLKAPDAALADEPRVGEAPADEPPPEKA